MEAFKFPPPIISEWPKFDDIDDDNDGLSHL